MFIEQTPWGRDHLRRFAPPSGEERERRKMAPVLGDDGRAERTTE